MKRVFLLIMAIFLVGPASAQGIDTFAVTASDTSREFPIQQATVIPVNVTVGCGFLLEHTGSLTVTLGADLPASWGATGSDVSFSAGPECLTSMGALTAEGTISIAPTASATGLEKRSFTIYANTTDGDSARYAHSSDVWVAYAPHHTMAPDISFPYEFTADDDGVLHFNVTVTTQANADTMVMFENLQTRGTISGLSHQSFFFSQGQTDRTRTLAVSWTPPASAWDNATITFYNYSHCLASGMPCDPQFEENVSWQIQNSAGNADANSGKESPGPGFLLIVGLAAVAFLARRRG